MIIPCPAAAAWRTGSGECRDEEPALRGQLDRPLQRGLVIAAAVAPAVDVEGRRPVDAAPDAALDVLLDAVGVATPGLEMAGVAPRVRDPELGRVGVQVVRVEVVLAVEEAVVHVPEAAPVGGGLG